MRGGREMTREDFKMVQTAIDNLSLLRQGILYDLSTTKSVSSESLCKSCRKSNICNPHNNYKIEALACCKYIKRKD
jgi:hypothetical protein